MHVELCEDGVQLGRHRVTRLMWGNDIKALQKRRYKKTTHSDHGGLVAPKLLDQDFPCDGLDQKWGVDISYIWTRKGWLYLAMVLEHCAFNLNQKLLPLKQQFAVFERIF